MRQFKRVNATFMVCAIIALSVLISPVFAENSSDPAGEKIRDYFTDLKLTTHEGQEVSFYSDVLEDRIVLIGGFYTHCATACPMQMKVLSQLQALLVEQMEKELGEKILIVSITLDPERDNLETLQDYAKRYSHGPGWLFLTGEKESVNWINYRLGQYAEVVERHTSYYLLGNLKSGQWLRIQPNADAEQLMELLREQASAS